MTTPSAAGRLIDAIPLAAQLRAYERPWLRADVLAALTVWALLVPQALAYGQLAGMDPVVGLYAALGAIVGYALIGGVREMSVGPEATIALLTVSVVAPLAGGDPARYAALAAGLALVTGVVLILGGLARLGFISRYLSRPLLTGYVAGSAIVMIVSQLDSLLGISLEAQDDTLAELTETIQRLPETDTTTLIVGLATMAVVLIVRRIDRRLPAYLFAVLAAIAASAILGLEAMGVVVVGEIPAGLPPIGLPSLGTGDISDACRRRDRGCRAGLRRLRCDRPGSRAARALSGRQQPRVPGSWSSQHRRIADGGLPRERQPVAQLHGRRCGRSNPRSMGCSLQSSPWSRCSS